MSIVRKMSGENETFIIFSDEIISKTIRFWIHLIILIPSIMCSLIFTIYILFNRIARNAIQNHVVSIVIFIGLIYQITLYPWMLNYYRMEGIWHRSALFCTIWAFFDWGLYYVQTLLFAWGTIERHILIFHDRWVSTKMKRFLVHYLPMIIILVYGLIFYIVVTFFPSCENVFDDFDMVCAGLCFTRNNALYLWDAIVHQTLPNLLIVIFSIALLVRVLYRKCRNHQAIQWRKHRKMTIQVLSIAILYLVFAFPISLLNLMYICGLSEDQGVELYEYLLFFNYLMLLFLPFACVLSLPELLKHFLNIRIPNRAIVPIS